MGVTTNEKLALLPKLDESIELSDDSALLTGPQNGVSISWNNLRVSADIKKQYMFRSSTHIFKEIIHDVSGVVEPSSLVAILGASGSGKSTLMSVLANRQPADLIINGEIRVNGRTMQSKYMKRISGFVYQDDLFVPTLTVSEHLHFTAQLKLDRSVTDEYRKKLINQLLTDVGLQKCTNNIIGSSSFGKGKVNLSGGEQKRLSVATELITDPPLLFCDEPTTGLDSFSALKLISIMKNMTSNRSKTIICSIHQPSEKIFHMFHRIILLYNGKIAFLGSSEDALSFFQSQGFEYTSDQNPAEYLVKSLAIIPGQEQQKAEKAKNIYETFEKSDYAKQINESIQNETNQQSSFMPPAEVKPISWFYRFYLITYRNLLGVVRDPAVQALRVGNQLVLALILGICMMGSVTKTQEGIQSLKGAVFTMVAENFFPPMYSVIDYIPSSMPVFLREYSNNMNTPLIYYLGLVFSLIPGFLIDAVLFTVIMYWLVGLNASMYVFSLTVIINILIILASSTFGLLLSIATGSVSMSQVAATPLDTFFMVMSGIFINLRTVPGVFYWVRYVSWMSYGLEALLILQLYDMNDIACYANPSLPCYKNGLEVLHSLDFSENNLFRNMYMIFIIIFTLHVLAYITLVTKLYLRTRR